MAIAFKYFVDFNSTNLVKDLTKQLDTFATDQDITLTLSNPYGNTYTLVIDNTINKLILFQGGIYDLVNYWNSAMMSFNFVSYFLPPIPLQQNQLI